MRWIVSAVLLGGCGGASISPGAGVCDKYCPGAEYVRTGTDPDTGAEFVLCRYPNGRSCAVTGVVDGGQ